ncbi:MAG: hypothetical protein V2I97_16595 [Desulfococcaceae bacterium]|jgi:hypothetical protein|nr:hypothetical protein [Desulfococcaceae bacterium]
MGLQAEYGLEADMPEDTDIIVAFQDKWFRDITLYLLDLKIIFMEPESKTIVAKGQSYRTSLARKSPEQMVKEVLDSIFAQKG